MAIIPVTPGQPDNPNSLTPETEATPGNPTPPTPEPAPTPGNPNSLTPEAEVSPGNPNSLTPESETQPVAPNTLTAEAAASTGNPNSLTAETAASAGNPNALTPEAESQPVAPNTLTEIAAAGFPRALTPLVDMHFDTESYAQNGNPVLFDDLFTYTRASSATFINRRIVNNKAEYFLDTDFVGTVTNLLTYSEQFDHADWLKISSASVTKNTARSPIGDLTADTVQFAASVVSRIDQIITSVATNSYTLSVWVKSDVNQSIELEILNTTSGKQSFLVGNIWQKIHVTGVASGTSITVKIENSNDGLIKRFFIWGAQLTVSVKPLPYVKTISTSASDTFIESLRIEYDTATGENLGALIEGFSTNLALRSEEFDNVVWTKTDSTITANDALSPDDTTSADKLTAGSTASIYPRVQSSITTIVSNSYTQSAYIRRSEASFVQITMADGEVANNPRANFDISNGVLGTVDADLNATITDEPNGYFRISVTFIAATISTLVRFALIKSATDARALNNSWTAGEGLFPWGVQFKQQSFRTSYIRTEGSTVAMTADDLNLPIAGNHPESNSDATYMIDVDLKSLPPGGTGSSRYLFNVNETSGFLAMLINSGGDLTVGHGTAVVAALDGSFGTKIKIVMVFDSSANNLKAYIDGVEVFSGDSGVQVALASTIFIGNDDSGALSAFSHIKEFAIYDQAFTAQEVALL